jgi:hypothetical protein
MRSRKLTVRVVLFQLVPRNLHTVFFVFLCEHSCDPPGANFALFVTKNTFQCNLHNLTLHYTAQRNGFVLLYRESLPQNSGKSRNYHILLFKAVIILLTNHDHFVLSLKSIVISSSSNKIVQYLNLVKKYILPNLSQSFLVI